LAPAFLGVVATVIVVACRSGSSELAAYPLVVVGCGVFLFPQLMNPRLRLRVDRPLCPSNWAWLLFAIQLVLQPILILLFGVYQGQLSTLPSHGSIEASFLLSCAAYCAFSAGLSIVLARPARRRDLGARLDSVPVGVVIVFVFVGLVAVLWRFRSASQLFSYFTGGYAGASGTLGPSSLSSTASTFLRPLGAYGLILLWARGASRRRMHPVLLVVCTAGALAILATYNYNRAAVVIPLVALAAAYGRHIRRLSLRTVITFGLIVLLAALAFGNFRRIEIGTQGGKYSLQQANLTTTPSVEQNIQLYGAAPQFTAVVVQNLSNGAGYYFGTTLARSVLAPAPIVGRTARLGSGTTLYNQLVYGRPGTVDQIIPFTAELDWNFGIYGVLAGFFLVGLIVARLQRAFDASDGIVSSFVLQYFAMWAAFLVIGSIQVVTQILVYFSLPVLLLALLSRKRNPDPGLAEREQGGRGRTDRAGLSRGN
jgi:oligosaccharide repeat unit polymerase